jgi:hypothetical protein
LKRIKKGIKMPNKDNSDNTIDNSNTNGVIQKKEKKLTKQQLEKKLEKENKDAELRKKYESSEQSEKVEIINIFLGSDLNRTTTTYKELENEFIIAVESLNDEEYKLVLKEFEYYDLNKEILDSVREKDKEKLANVIKKYKDMKTQLIKELQEFETEIHKKTKNEDIKNPILKKIVNAKNENLMELKCWIETYVVFGDYQNDIDAGVYNGLEGNEFVKQFFKQIGSHARVINKDGTGLEPFKGELVKFDKDGNIVFNHNTAGKIDIIYQSGNKLYFFDVTADTSGKMDKENHKPTEELQLPRHLKLIQELEKKQDKRQKNIFNYYFISMPDISDSNEYKHNSFMDKNLNYATKALLGVLSKNWHTTVVLDSDLTKKRTKEIRSRIHNIAYSNDGYGKFRIIQKEKLKIEIEQFYELCNIYSKSFINGKLNIEKFKKNISNSKTLEPFKKLAHDVNNVLLHRKKNLEEHMLNTVTGFMNFVVTNHHHVKFAVSELALASKFKIKTAENVKILIDKHFKSPKWMFDGQTFVDNEFKLEEQIKITDENKKIADENKKIADENKKIADENKKIADENKKIADEKDGVIVQQSEIIVEKDKKLEEKDEIIAQQQRENLELIKKIEELRNVSSEENNGFMCSDINGIIKPMKFITINEELKYFTELLETKKSGKPFENKCGGYIVKVEGKQSPITIKGENIVNDKTTDEINENQENKKQITKKNKKKPNNDDFNR